MASYNIEISRAARKVIEKLPKAHVKAVTDAIRALGENPRPSGCTKLSGVPGFRIRVGVYRVVYEIKDDVLVVVVIAVGHRKDVYR